MLDFINEIIKNPFFSIATGLLGCLIGNRLSLGRDKRKEFNAAASVFREAFTGEIISLGKEKGRRPDWGDVIHGRQTAYEIISASIKKHTTAYITFKHYIGSKRQLNPTRQTRQD